MRLAAISFSRGFAGVALATATLACSACLVNMGDCWTCLRCRAGISIDCATADGGCDLRASRGGDSTRGFGSTGSVAACNRA